MGFFFEVGLVYITINSNAWLKFELLHSNFRGAHIQNLNSVDLVKFFKKIQKLHIHIVAVNLKVKSCMTKPTGK
jgi:hypothetical protein